MNLDAKWEVPILELSYPSMYQNATVGNLFYDDKLSKTLSERLTILNLDCVPPYDIVEAMNTLTQEKNNHRDTSIKIKVCRVTQKVKVYLANEESSLAYFSTDVGHIFGGEVRNDLGIRMRGKSLHEPIFAYDIVRIQSLMIYTDNVEYSSVGDPNAPSLRYFPFISKLKSGDIITTGKDLNYQIFSSFQFKQ